uniref:A-kinase anchoring protein 17A n=1 Tax=Ornithorhynchus anatinus TaxID=9258 RepID=F6ZHL0_ORNAN
MDTLLPLPRRQALSVCRPGPGGGAMAAATIVHDPSEAVELCPPQGLYLKPITKMTISVALPQLKQPGKSISNWEVMERLKAMVQAHQFSTLRISKSTMDFIRFEGEVENKSLIQPFLARLDGKTIKLSGFSDTLKVRAAEFKTDFPTRHDWDSFFRDAEDMNETLPGERPDTVHLGGLPCKWFARKESGSEKPSEAVVVRVFEAFGEIRTVDIPMLDPYREEMTGRNFHTFSFGGHLNFEAYVQYREYAGFVRAMNALRGMKLMYKGDDGKAVACNIKEAKGTGGTGKRTKTGGQAPEERTEAEGPGNAPQPEEAGEDPGGGAEETPRENQARRKEAPLGSEESAVHKADCRAAEQSKGGQGGGAGAEGGARAGRAGAAGAGGGAAAGGGGEGARPRPPQEGAGAPPAPHPHPAQQAGPAPAAPGRPPARAPGPGGGGPGGGGGGRGPAARRQQPRPLHPGPRGPPGSALPQGDDGGGRRRHRRPLPRRGRARGPRAPQALPRRPGLHPRQRPAGQGGRRGRRAPQGAAPPRPRPRAPGRAGQVQPGAGPGGGPGRPGPPPPPRGPPQAPQEPRREGRRPPPPGGGRGGRGGGGREAEEGAEAARARPQPPAEERQPRRPAGADHPAPGSRPEDRPAPPGPLPQQAQERLDEVVPAIFPDLLLLFLLLLPPNPVGTTDPQGGGLRAGDGFGGTGDRPDAVRRPRHIEGRLGFFPFFPLVVFFFCFGFFGFVFEEGQPKPDKYQPLWCKRPRWENRRRGGPPPQSRTARGHGPKRARLLSGRKLLS